MCYFIFSNIYLGFGSEVWLLMFRVMNFQDIYSPLWKVQEKSSFGNISSVQNKFLFSRNIYGCPHWIFIFDSDQAPIYSVDETIPTSHPLPLSLFPFKCLMTTIAFCLLLVSCSKPVPDWCYCGDSRQERAGSVCSPGVQPSKTGRPPNWTSYFWYFNNSYNPDLIHNVDEICPSCGWDL